MENIDIMPQSISFKSYKRFSGPENLEFRPMTILLGKNSSGKSSIIKLLLSISQAISNEYTKVGLPYKGDGYSLGTSFQNLCHNGNMFDFKVGVQYDASLKFEATMMMNPGREVAINHYSLVTPYASVDARLENNGRYTVNGDKDVILEFHGLVSDKILSLGKISSIPKIIMDYIGPLRTAPQRTWYVSGNNHSNVGPDGIYAYQILYENPDLKKKVSKWFEDNLEGYVLDIAKGDEPGSFRVVVSRPDNGEYKVNIADVGMGIIQVLPIIVRAFLNKTNSIIGIEQPELHLHPAAHSSVAALLANTSRRLKQTYIVETHSENFLLGIREMVVNPECDFSADDVVVYFIDEDENGAYIKKIFINPDGTLTDWPMGVFNESYDLLKSIMKNSKGQK